MKVFSETSLRIERHLKVPTGDILVVTGETGRLEMLSLGDYGQAVNLNQHRPVPDGLPLLPLTDKWVVTISTQYGCNMHCEFCDVPLVGPGRNASFRDLVGQILTALSLPGVPSSTKRLNIHFARMGEPTWNPAVLECAEWIQFNLSDFTPHPVVSTMMPRHNRHLSWFIGQWMKIKNEIYGGNAGLQLSINSTNEIERERMFKGNALPLADIAGVMRGLVPIGRKITLNFAVANYEVDPDILLRWFSPDHFIVKLTPMHKTLVADYHGVKTEGDYTAPEPYLPLEDKLKTAGYDVLTFIASHDEDASRITCGNAILSGSLPHKFKEIEPCLNSSSSAESCCSPCTTTGDYSDENGIKIPDFPPDTPFSSIRSFLFSLKRHVHSRKKCSVCGREEWCKCFSLFGEKYRFTGLCDSCTQNHSCTQISTDGEEHV